MTPLTGRTSGYNLEKSASTEGYRMEHPKLKYTISHTERRFRFSIWTCQVISSKHFLASAVEIVKSRGSDILNHPSLLLCECFWVKSLIGKYLK